MVNRCQRGAVLQRHYPVLQGGETAVVEQQAAPVRLPFHVDIPFTKAATIDAKGNLELVGYASTWVLDRDGEYIDPRAFDDSLPAFLAKNPILLWQHNMDWPLGQIVEAKIDANGLLVRAIVRKPSDSEERWKISAYNDIAAGIVRTFSIGGFFTRDFAAGRILVTEIELLEISVVSIPSNPDSIFEAAQKALHGGLRPTLPQKAVDQMQQLLGLRVTTDPELVLLQRRGAGALGERYELLSGLYRKAGKLPPGREVWDEAQSEPDPRKRLLRVVDAMELVSGRVDLKAGRVLSKANEGKLRQAAELITGVLAQLDKADEQSTAPAVTGVHDYRGDGGPCKVCGEPPDHPDHSGGKGVLEADPEYARKLVAAIAAAKGTTPTFKDFPLATRDRAWTAASARKRIRTKTGAADSPNRAYANCHFWYQGDDPDGDGVPDNYGDYHLLFCDVIGGEIQAVPRGIFACAVIMQGGRGGLPKDMPDSDVGKVKNHIGRYYAKMRKEFNDDGIVAPWDKGA